MTRRLVLWGVVVVLGLGGVALIVPASPVYLPKLFNPAGQQGGHSIRYWMNALDSPNPETRYQAMLALGSMGDSAAEAVPALGKIMVEDPDVEARHQAALALSKMVPASKTAVPQLAQALEDKDPHIRMEAAITLFRLREDARPAVPALIKALNNPDNKTNLGTFLSTIQEMVARALGAAGSDSPEALAALQAAAEKANTEDMRLATARALGDMGPAAKPATPQLELLLKDDSREVRKVAQESLDKINGAPDKGKDHEDGKKSK